VCVYVWASAHECMCVCEFMVSLALSISHMSRVGQNHIYTPYMTVYLVISLPKIPYIHRTYMVLANPTHE